MVKDSDGVAMLKDVTDWRPPRRHDGVIIISPPAGSIPSRLLGELPGELAPASASPLPQAPAGSQGIGRERKSSGGVVTGADCAPWTPPRPQGGLIVDGRWIGWPHPPDAAAPSEDERGVASTAPKRRIRKH